MMIMRTIETPVNKKPPEQHRGLPAGDHHRWYIVLLVSCSPAELTSSSDVQRKDGMCQKTAQVDIWVLLSHSQVQCVICRPQPEQSFIRSIVPVYHYNAPKQVQSTGEDFSLNYPVICPIDGGKLRYHPHRLQKCIDRSLRVVDSQ
jgi:hypothetical protein